MNVYQIPENSRMERFRLHYLENYELSEADAKVLVIWEAAHSLILDDCVENPHMTWNS